VFVSLHSTRIFSGKHRNFGSIAQGIWKLFELDKKKWLDIIMGDPDWLNWPSSGVSQWRTIGTQTETMSVSMIRTAESMISVFFSLWRFLVTQVSPKKRSSDSKCMTVDIRRERELQIREARTLNKLKW
jgi:hypothetical protein